MEISISGLTPEQRESETHRSFLLCGAKDSALMGEELE
jgi:hypothetical protein